MATKKFIIEMEEGHSGCYDCPFHHEKCQNFQIGEVDDGLDCSKYNLATMKIKELEEEKCSET